MQLTQVRSLNTQLGRKKYSFVLLPRMRYKKSSYNQSHGRREEKGIMDVWNGSFPVDTRDASLGRPDCATTIFPNGLTYPVVQIAGVSSGIPPESDKRHSYSLTPMARPSSFHTATR